MVEFTNVDGKDCGDVKLFALSTCGWCKRTRKYFEDAGIAYSYIYVDKLHGDDRKEAIKIMRKYDKSESFPTIVVDNSECIVGFNKGKIDSMIGD